MNFFRKFRDFIAYPSRSRTMGALVMLVLVSAVSLTVIVAQQQQTIKQRAATSACTTDYEANAAQCSEAYGDCYNGCVDDNVYDDGLQLDVCIATCKNTRDACEKMSTDIQTTCNLSDIPLCGSGLGCNALSNPSDSCSIGRSKCLSPNVMYFEKAAKVGDKVVVCCTAPTSTPTPTPSAEKFEFYKTAIPAAKTLDQLQQYLDGMKANVATTKELTRDQYDILYNDYYEPKLAQLTAAQPTSTPTPTTPANAIPTQAPISTDPCSGYTSCANCLSSASCAWNAEGNNPDPNIHPCNSKSKFPIPAGKTCPTGQKNWFTENCQINDCREIPPTPTPTKAVAPPASPAPVSSVALEMILNTQDASSASDDLNVELTLYNSSAINAPITGALARSRSFTKTANASRRQYSASDMSLNTSSLKSGTKYIIFAKKGNTIARSSFVFSDRNRITATPATLVFGDLNNDGWIDLEDHDGVFKACWRKKTAAGSCSSSDFDGNGIIDQIDYNGLMKGWAIWSMEDKKIAAL